MVRRRVGLWLPADSKKPAEGRAFVGVYLTNDPLREVGLVVVELNQQLAGPCHTPHAFVDLPIMG